MNETFDHDEADPGKVDLPELVQAGHTLRGAARPLRAEAVQVAALRRRARNRGRLAIAACAIAVVGIASGALISRGSTSDQITRGLSADGVQPDGPEVDRLIGSLGPSPVNPTKVRLVSTVATFKSCDALIGDLRKVGAQHVGSRGFGADTGRFMAVGAAVDEKSAAVADTGAANAAAVRDGGDTLGTNVQVSGVDELDRVKAQGQWIYDLDGKGNLRITDATSLDVVSTLRIVTQPDDTGGRYEPPDTTESLASILVADGHLAVFGSKSVLSKAIPGDPSATRSSTEYLTLTFVDATNPARPKVTDRIDLEGSLVSARLVGGQIRLVATSNMADLGFVMPTTPASVAKALDRNRRSVAASSVDDWIPQWQRKGDAGQPLVPCDRVHVPTTFAGVAMTSMVSFPIGNGRFVPEATSILAPGDTLYAGLDDVAISSHVWVDPADQQRLKFPDWQTAIHEFSFTKDGAPDYVGSGIVDGSTVGQFAFGEVGNALGVVSTKGTPWNQDLTNSVDLTLFTPDGKGGLSTTATVTDLAGGKGAVDAVRFTPGRVLVSTGAFGNLVRVVDVDDPAHPSRAGSVTLPGPTGYFHPLEDHQALLVGSRTDDVPGPNGSISRQWVVAQLLDVSNAATPKLVATWEQPWAADSVGNDHHAFTFWPDRKLAMWGIQSARYDSDNVNHAIVLNVDGGLTQTAFPEASRPPASPPPCPEVKIDDPQVRRQLGEKTIVLGCAQPAPTGELEWPRYQCWEVSDDMMRRYAPNFATDRTYYSCSLAPEPTVARVLVVKGRPILMTDQTFEALDPTTFASTQVVFHSTQMGFMGPRYD